MSVADGRVPVLWISGPPGVGKSTVSWQLFTELAQAGAHVAFADTDQFCMCYPAPPGDPGREVIKAQNVGALVPRFRAAGARCVIANGVLDPVRGVYPELMQTYIRVLPAASVTAIRLHAGRAELTRRIMSRGAGGSWPQPGDPLCGQPREILLRAAGRAAAEAGALERAVAGIVRIDTDGRTVAEAVDAIAAVTG